METIYLFQNVSNGSFTLSLNIVANIEVNDSVSAELSKKLFKIPFIDNKIFSITNQLFRFFKIRFYK